MAVGRGTFIPLSLTDCGSSFAGPGRVQQLETHFFTTVTFAI